MFIWIKRWIFRARIFYLTWRMRDKEIVVNLALVKTLLRIPAMELLQEYHPSKGHGITLQVGFRNVTDFITVLTEFTNHINNREYIPDQLLMRFMDRPNKRLDDFLVVGPQSYPVRPTEFYPILMDLVNDFDKALSSLETDSAWPPYYKRKSEIFIKDIYFVLEALLRAAYSE